MAQDSSENSRIPQVDFEALEAEEDEDPTFDETSVYTETTSLDSSIIKYREENGRRYHNYGLQEHWGPNDEAAQEQQDISHYFFYLVAQGKLWWAPIEKPRKILDLGTGTGLWAIDAADAHPEAEVKGTDLSPIQPTWVPPNLKFEIDDYNIDWLDTNKYDLIHLREVLGTSPSFPALYKNIYNALTPGGWIDQLEPRIDFYTAHPPSRKVDSVLVNRWSTLMREAGTKSGLSFDIAPYMQQWLEEAGFVNVTVHKLVTPIGKWPKDKRERDVGYVNRVRFEQGIVDFCGRRLTNNMGWTPEEVERWGARCRTEVCNTKLLLYMYCYYATAQKPMEKE